jgi:tetratricopeptide (TPR) repeat protein
MATEWKGGNAADLCEHFQLDLSCLIDGELEESASARALLHLEVCGSCRGFFEDSRRCLRLHLDVADPERLLAHVTGLTGQEIASGATAVELVHKLATIFYQLGKAYVLSGLDPDWIRTRVFEKAVDVEPTQTRGRGFVDGVLLGGQATDDAAKSEGGNEAGNDADERAESSGRGFGGVDWRHARSMLNGRLKEIPSGVERGRRLLEEALAADPTHEEARLYLAFLHAHEGKRLLAAREYGEIFESAMAPANRGHAAVQLGRLYEQEGDHRRALTYFRWVTLSGLEREDPRFYFALFNIGLQYALIGDQTRSLHYFRQLIDRHPDQLEDIVRAFASSPRLQAAVEGQRGFSQALVATCPELFGAA